VAEQPGRDGDERVIASRSQHRVIEERQFRDVALLVAQLPVERRDSRVYKIATHADGMCYGGGRSRPGRDCSRAVTSGSDRAMDSPTAESQSCCCQAKKSR
jgi:hypothetical protein